jgi:hypothetical protein
MSNNVVAAQKESWGKVPLMGGEEHLEGQGNRYLRAGAKCKM